MNDTPVSWVEPIAALVIIGLLAGAAIACRTFVALLDYLLQPSPCDMAWDAQAVEPAPEVEWRYLVRNVTLLLALMAVMLALLLISWLRTAAGS